MNTENKSGRLIVVSNRLPVVLSPRSNGWHVEPGSGGLVTALAPVLRDRGGTWIGWPGTEGGEGIEQALRETTGDIGYSLVPVPLSREMVEKHYRGFSNEIVWPLFHDLQSHCNFDPSYWNAYREVNRSFARSIAENSKAGDFVWVHDYHLMLVASELRATGYTEKLAFFLHIPFPPLEIFEKLPWRSQVLEALVQFDLIGFQTMRDRRNFFECLKAFRGSVSLCARGQVCEIKVKDKRIRVGAFPISIDAGEFERQAASPEVAEGAWLLHENLPDRQIILGVDRMDYTKGIPLRIKAFRQALRRHSDLRGKVTLAQVVVPSRRGIPEYEALKLEIEQLVGEINGEFTGESGWIPIHYVYRSLDRRELLSYYRTAEIALVTPLKDGMNLVAKEFCASSLEEDGVLILSEFAGAAAELHKNSLMVNPYDVVGVADAIYQAFSMEYEERRRRMHGLRQSIRRRDIFWWVDSFLKASIARSLESFPVIADYRPPLT